MAELYKRETKPLPVHIHPDWIAFFADVAVELGISRNSAFCMAVKMGGPMLKAHVALMRKSVARECRRIASGKLRVSQILHSPPKLRRRAKRAA